jgi:hypothetical protein
MNERHLSFRLAAFLLGLVSLPAAEPAAPADSWPPFEDVLRLLRSNLPDVTEHELNRALVAGLLDRFHPRVVLVRPDAAALPAGSLLIGGVAAYDRTFGYIRLTGVGTDLPAQLASALGGLRATNRLDGLILDLRFADGQDYTAAARAADPFVKDERRLLSWAGTSIRSTAEADAVAIPLAVLVNQETSGAAEALAAALREAGTALLVGRRTAGQAYVFREFDLPAGQKLRVAAEPVTAGQDRTLTDGVTPDIEVSVSAAEERTAFADPFARLPGSAPAGAPTARAVRPPQNEAELVRQRRESNGPDAGTGVAPAARTAPAEPRVTDPDLVRALDLLKGIAVVRRAR